MASAPQQPPTVQQAMAEALQEAAYNCTALDNIAVLVVDVRGYAPPVATLHRQTPKLPIVLKWCT